MSETDSSNVAEEVPREPEASGNSLQKCCWVCYATESDDALASWVQPCNCKGTSKWVHQACLQRWVDEMQKGNISRKVNCPQCKAEYILVFPCMGPLVAALDATEEITHKMCPFIAGGVMLGSLYWTAITYGAVTVMQVAGHKEGMEMLEAADPLVLLLLLPAVPIALICGRALRWEDALLLALRRTCRKLPILTLLLPFGDPEGTEQNPEQGEATTSAAVSENSPILLQGHTSPTRILCGALILPSVSTLVGRILFSSVKNNFHRTILGGLTFIVIKGALNIYHKQKLHVRHSTRRILDYTEENIRLYKTGTPATNLTVPTASPSGTSGITIGRNQENVAYSSDQRVV